MKAGVSATAFAHLRGNVLAPPVIAASSKATMLLRTSAPILVNWNGALRLLESQGWLHRPKLTPATAEAIRIAPPFYREVVSFIPMAIFLEDFLFRKSQGGFLPMLQVLVAKAQAGWDPTLPTEIRQHLDGMLIGPAVWRRYQSSSPASKKRDYTRTCASSRRSPPPIWLPSASTSSLRFRPDVFS